MAQGIQHTWVLFGEGQDGEFSPKERFLRQLLILLTFLKCSLKTICIQMLVHLRITARNKITSDVKFFSKYWQP